MEADFYYVKYRGQYGSSKFGIIEVYLFEKESGNEN
jgi:hypothetical protein